jgi:hypothetical protein
MQISSNLSAYGAASARYSQSKNEVQTDANSLLRPQNLKDVSQLKQNASKLSAREISNGYFAQFQAQAFSQANSSTTAQSALDAIFSGSNFKAPGNLSEILGVLDYAAMGYEGKAIGELNKDEASELIGENGFFGINNTADRIANFIVNAAGGDYAKLQAGREGMLRGFNEARKIWGGELPEISEKTITRATEAIERKIAEAGGNVLNVSA